MLMAYCQDIREMLQNGGIRTKYDIREEPSIGRRFNEWEVKGVPIRYEVGSKELAERKVTISRRDTGEKITVDRSAVLVETEKLLDIMQKSLFDKVSQFRKDNTHDIDSYEEFKNIMSTTRGFIRSFWCEDAACEKKIKEETKASTRCLPMDHIEEKGQCIYCQKEATHRWLFAQAY